MPVNQLKLKKQLVDEFGFSDHQAEGITTAVTQAEEEGVTSKDLDILRKDIDLMEARLRKLIWRQAIAVISVLGALIAVLEFMAA